MHLPALISDLALMLLAAGIITVLFKKLKQPLVLGYLVAGFLISHYIPFLPAVEDISSIETWSEIGIIVLMFYLGLEFNLHKLAQVGGTAIITAILEVAGMLIVGFSVGQLLGWSTMDSIFLGGMLSMSSTTIIIKAFDELQLKKEKFTELVFGTLVIEDIAAIFMMIVLSTISVSKNIAGGALTLNLLMLLFYLALWLILGIYLLPTWLNRAANFMNDETLLISSLGICFGMVLLANKLGFSSALGAFMAGSLLAGTVHAERVEHLTKGVRDLFGAVFFLSVGMLVDPTLLVQHIGPILLISLVVIFGQPLFGIIGMLLSGQPFRTAVRGGLSLSQIGEFSFIIASLGLSLGVTGDYLYPIVVSVAVITTFTTPFYIKAANGIGAWLETRLPKSLLDKLSRYTDAEQSDKEHDSDWPPFIKRYFFTTSLYGVIMLGVFLLGTRLLLPRLEEMLPPLLAAGISFVVVLVGVSLFIRPLLDPHNHHYTALWLKSRSFRPPLIVLTVLRIALVVVLAMATIKSIWHIHTLWLIPLIIVAIILLARWHFLASFYLQFEARFLVNFNERHLKQDAKISCDWLDERLFLTWFTCEEGGAYLGKSLKELDLGRRFGTNVIKILRGHRHINLPEGSEILHAEDTVYLLGEAKQLQNCCMALKVPYTKNPPTLRDFIRNQGEEDDSHNLFCCVVKVEKDSPFVNTSIRDSGIRKDWNCLLLGLQRKQYPIIKPDISMLLRPDDILWVLGTRRTVGHMAAEI